MTQAIPESLHHHRFYPGQGRIRQPAPMIHRRGIIQAVEHIGTRSAESTGYTALVQMGMEDKSFEAVVLRHPDVFSAEAVRRSKQRLNRL